MKKIKDLIEKILIDDAILYPYLQPIIEVDVYLIIVE